MLGWSSPMLPDHPIFFWSSCPHALIAWLSCVSCSLQKSMHKQKKEKREKPQTHRLFSSFFFSFLAENKVLYIFSFLLFPVFAFSHRGFIELFFTTCFVLLLCVCMVNTSQSSIQYFFHCNDKDVVDFFLFVATMAQIVLDVLIPWTYIRKLLIAFYYVFIPSTSPSWRLVYRQEWLVTSTVETWGWRQVTCYLPEKNVQLLPDWPA